MANEQIQEGFEVFVSDADKLFGAVRQVSPHGRAGRAYSVSSDCSPGYGDGRQQRALHMVFLSERRPEESHEPIPGELWRRAAITVHLRQARLEKGTDEVVHPLGSEPFGERGRVDDVAKEDGNLFDFAG